MSPLIPHFPGTSMSINSHSKDNILTIQLLDERLMDEGQLKRIYNGVIALLDKTTEKQVILEFSKVQFMSSSMLGKLVQIHKKCKEYKVKLKLCGISSDILEVFKITKLHKLFDIETDEASARKAFSKRGLFG
jgi:anti-anti-sigma factor